jgi:flagellar biosynthesis protein FlhF
MRMRSIFARDMQEAIAIARRDMGEDAVMLQSERPKAGNGLVVTFGIEEREDFALADAAPIAFAKPAAPKEPAITARGMEAIARPIQKPAAKPVEAVSLLAKTLEWHGIPKPLTDALLTAARETRGRSSANPVDAAEMVLAETAARVFTFKPIATQKPTRALMCVGAPGVGKTTAIAKLATDAVKRGQSLRVITTDTSRAAAYDQLAAFTEILGIPLALAENRTALREQLRTVPPGALTLIDTAGCNPYDFQELKQLGELAKLQDVEPVLVLPLGIDANEAQETAGVFTFLDIERIIVTRADCARRFGGICASVQAGGFALANVSASLNVSDGCPALDAATLAHYLIRPMREKLK